MYLGALVAEIEVAEERGIGDLRPDLDPDPEASPVTLVTVAPALAPALNRIESPPDQDLDLKAVGKVTDAPKVL